MNEQNKPRPVAEQISRADDQSAIGLSPLPQRAGPGGRPHHFVEGAGRPIPSERPQIRKDLAYSASSASGAWATTSRSSGATCARSGPRPRGPGGHRRRRQPGPGPRRLSRLPPEGFGIAMLFDTQPGRSGCTPGAASPSTISGLQASRAPANRSRSSVVAVPAASAQAVVNPWSQAGVKAILNFSPGTIPRARRREAQPRGPDRVDGEPVVPSGSFLRPGHWGGGGGGTECPRNGHGMPTEWPRNGQGNRHGRRYGKGLGQ